MQSERPYVLTVAGLDPCSGAGLTADIKTFEQLKVYGLAVCTGTTRQTEDEFFSVNWRSLDEVQSEIELMLLKYPVRAVKFGIVPSFDFLNHLVQIIKRISPEVKIIVDPVRASTAGFIFNESIFKKDETFLKSITLITPNVPEFEFMSEGDPGRLIEEVVLHSNLLLKGGHNSKNKGHDVLHHKNGVQEFPARGVASSKHGSGCVLSAAITAYLALGNELEEACRKGKIYTELFLNSNTGLLGYHAT